MSKDAIENFMAWTFAGARSGMNEYEVRDHSHRKAFGKIDRLVAIFFFQVTLIHQDICSQQPFYLPYTWPNWFVMRCGWPFGKEDPVLAW